jgi:hypothetical protein
MIKQVLTFFITFFLLLSFARAQSCPPFIEGELKVNKADSDWRHVAGTERFYLSNVHIIEGPPADAGLPEGRLVPIQKNGAQLWTFSSPVGKYEMWMRCEYEGTMSTLISRIHADVSECRKSSRPDPTNARKTKVHAACFKGVGKK